MKPKLNFNKIKASHLVIYGIYTLAGLLFIALSIYEPDRFLTMRNFRNILVQASPRLILAIGMAFTLLTSGLDMSIGSVVFLSAAAGALMMEAGVSIVLSCLIILLIGISIGLFNGITASILGVYPLLTTLAVLYIARGIGLHISRGRIIGLPMEIHVLSDTFLNIPIPIWIAAFCMFLMHIILEYTPFGRQIYAVGNDEQIAKESGINVFKIKTMCYVISGLMASIGAIVWLGQLGTVSPTLGVDMEFVALIAAAVGGVSLAGGRGKIIPGVLVGTLILALISNILVILRASPYFYPVVQGIVILIAVLADTLKQKMETKN